MQNAWRGWRDSPEISSEAMSVSMARHAAGCEEKLLESTGLVELRKAGYTAALGRRRRNGHHNLYVDW